MAADAGDERPRADFTRLLARSRSIAAETDPSRLLALGAESARELAGAKRAAVVLLADEGGASLPRVATAGFEEEVTLGPSALPLLVGEVLSAGRVAKRSAFDPQLLGFSGQLPQFATLLFAAVSVAGAPRGFVCAIDKVGAPDFDEADAQCLELLATEIGLAHHNAVLAQHAQATESKYRTLVEQIPAAEHDRRLDTPGAKKLEEQLRQSQKMDAIGKLAGGVAHDFNNLLSVILTYGAMLLEGRPDGEALAEDLREIVGAAERAKTLTAQLLAFSRQQVLMPKVVDLGLVVEGMSGMLRRLIREDVELVTRASPGLRKVKADPGQIEQVILNLAVNARDAMPDGGTLIIEAQNADLDEGFASDHLDVAPGRYVMLAVTDTGVGMDEATRARVFEPFFTTKDQGKGTGLGLSTVLGIVQQSGGTVWIDSKPGRGTTIQIYLPQTEDGATAAQPFASPNKAPRGSETVLLVEDDDQVRKLVLTILTRYGYRALPARHGEEALQLCRENSDGIDLLLTDVVMPKMSGRQLAEQVAAVCPRTKVLFMSGYTSDAVLRHGIESTRAQFVQKPFRAEELARAVRAAIDG